MMNEQKASNRRPFCVPIDDLKPMFIISVRPSEAEKTKDIFLLNKRRTSVVAKVTAIRAHKTRKNAGKAQKAGRLDQRLIEIL